MQPSPIAETSRPKRPNVRFSCTFIRSLLSESRGVRLRYNRFTNGQWRRCSQKFISTLLRNSALAGDKRISRRVEDGGQTFRSRRLNSLRSPDYEYRGLMASTWDLWRDDTSHWPDRF